MKLFPCFFGVLVIIVSFSRGAMAEQETLEEAWAFAYRNNPSLEAERARLRALDEQVSLALSNWRPNLEVTSSIGKLYQRIPAQRGFPATEFSGDSSAYGAQITQPLFRGFRTLEETQAAKKQVLAGRARLQSAEQQLLLDTAAAFLSIVRDEFILNAQRENESVLRKILDETSARARVGDLTRTDVEQSRSRLARAEVATAQTRNALMAERAAYARLVGHEPGSLLKPTLAPGNLGNLDDLLRLAETRNPSVVAARYTYEQSDAEIAAGKGRLLPEVNIVGNASHNYTQQYNTPGRSDTGQVMLQLRIPLYEAGADYARIRAAQQTGVQYRMELAEARNRALETLKSAWNAFIMAETKLKSAALEIEAAARALEGVKVEVRYGARTTLDQLNAEQEFLDARSDLARAENDRVLALLQIRQTIGELTVNSLKLPIEPYDPQKHYDDVHYAWIGFGGVEEDIYATVGQPPDEFGAYDK